MAKISAFFRLYQSPVFQLHIVFENLADIPLGMLSLIYKDQQIYFELKQFVTGAKCAYSATNFINIQNSMADVLPQQQN